MKFRYYDPEVNRFITIDDISYIDPETINGLNLYAYCGNNPVMCIDENGDSWDSFCKGVKNFFTRDIPNFFTKTIPNWWNNDVVPFFTRDVPDWWDKTKIKVGTWVENNIIDPMKKGFSAIENFFKSTLPNWWNGTVVPWWNQIKFDVGMCVESWFKPLEEEMYQFAELWQTNPLINLIIFVGVIGLAPFGFFRVLFYQRYLFELI